MSKRDFAKAKRADIARTDRRVTREEVRAEREQQYGLKTRTTDELKERIDRLSAELDREPYYPRLARDALVHIHQLVLKKDFRERQKRRS